jgi:hypothetical protein
VRFEGLLGFGLSRILGGLSVAIAVVAEGEGVCYRTFEVLDSGWAEDEGEVVDVDGDVDVDADVDVDVTV